MATKSIAWNTGSGNINVDYGGSGDGTITITSDSNSLYEARSQQITIRTTDGSNIERTVTIQQAAKVRIDISSAVVTASNQTYSGSAKTPTPTVTLNGSTVPSSGYDVAYSNNTNAGTATITVTGKGNYTGATTGTFTIAKASRTLSFASTYDVVAPSGNATNTATPSSGSGDGAITYSISSTTYATINSSSGKVTAKTSDGSAVVTATIAEGTNYLSASASYNLYVFATAHNFSYTGSVQSLLLPPGSYKLQVWGAQGGSVSGNYTANGAKGGYSEGVKEFAEATTVYAFVGGQGSSASTSTTSGTANGGWNGGGGAARRSSYNSGDTNGISYPRPGGGATDISTVTSDMSYSSYRNNRSAASLNARLIVAGGGAGASARYTSTTTETKTTIGTVPFFPVSDVTINGHTTNAWTNNYGVTYNEANAVLFINDNPFSVGDVIEVTLSSAIPTGGVMYIGTHQSTWKGSWGTIMGSISAGSTSCRFTAVATTSSHPSIMITFGNPNKTAITATFKKVTTSTSTSSGTSDGSQVGGGTSGGGTNPGTQSGGGGELGKGANMTQTGYRYCSGGGGGGYYGGGASYDDSTTDKINQSGGGSGYVDSSLTNAQTKAGNTSFPKTSGSGNETGHSGNGYAKITRLS